MGGRAAKALEAFKPSGPEAEYVFDPVSRKLVQVGRVLYASSREVNL